ncbi:Zinc finger CCCH domain-containing protein 15 [Sciurus carolinensis]|uniref:Zinc finger CCCH domain-containing protein 15 n=1 Tax=Sciurus carolinensis TaxID=30640 RepID=A0AA41NJS0_SCICA|nr:Zinc finger CCCH domain-containing protein 15 [Sciurus carolinensis]
MESRYNKERRSRCDEHMNPLTIEDISLESEGAALLELSSLPTATLQEGNWVNCARSSPELLREFGDGSGGGYRTPKATMDNYHRQRNRARRNTDTQGSQLPCSSLPSGSRNLEKAQRHAKRRKGARAASLPGAAPPYPQCSATPTCRKGRVSAANERVAFRALRRRRRPRLPPFAVVPDLPKKQAQAGGSKKAEQKKKEKIIEDKTFGLKNKKGAKQQKFIKAVTHQVKFGQQNPRQVAQSEAEKKLKKDDKKKELQELNELFKPVVAAQKISKGADPKSVVCAFFKQGQCTKGDKCKFSHDLTLERKCEKRSVYIDARDEELEKDTMDNWDEKKLEEVVNKKHGEAEKKKPKTQIVCKHFLEAIENNKYGWFWVCPGGGDNCMYRHALPPGFVLKKDKKKEEKEDEISLEDLIERERSALGPNVTKITLESFLAWKRRKRQEKIDKLEQDMERRKADFKAGKALVISGREVFEFRPELVNDDDEEADDTRYTQGTGGDEVDDSVSVNDIDLSLYIPRDVAETGITVASLERFSTYASDKDENKLSEASGGRAENGERSDLEEDIEGEGQENGAIDAVPVDENLFTGEDLDELEEELNTLDLEE